TKEHPLNGPPMFVARFADGLVPYYGNGRCVMPADRAGSDLVAEAKQASCLAQEETWGVRMNREIEARYGPDSLAAGPEETSDEGQLAEENQQTEQNETMQNETTSEYQSVALEVLMPISSNAEVKFPVSARKLHQFMEIGKDFSTWITSRVKQFKLVEGKDFEVSPNFGENPQGGRPSTEYWLTLEMAKYLSMLERNERGDEARRYFIRCEEQLTALQRPHRQLTHGDLARMILEEESAKLAALAGKEQAHKAMGHLVITVGARLQEQDAVIAEVGSRLMSCGRGWKIVR
ncbi:MAG: antA/AntB antirepressor family protein, partial [Verrucomicrobiota bacterium]